MGSNQNHIVQTKDQDWKKIFLFVFLVNNNDCEFKTWFKIHYSAPNVENKPPLGILSTALLHGSIVKQQITEHTAMNVYEGDCLGKTVDLKLWEEEVAEGSGKRWVQNWSPCSACPLYESQINCESKFPRERADLVGPVDVLTQYIFIKCLQKEKEKKQSRKYKMQSGSNRECYKMEYMKMQHILSRGLELASLWTEKTYGNWLFW